MEPPRDEATAYHEAGHAVMALALGRPVACVSIVPGREFLGTCDFGKAVFRPSEDWLEREILIALAGAAAEARRTGEYAWDAAARDQTYAEGLALQRAGAAVRPNGCSAGCCPRRNTCSAGRTPGAPSNAWRPS